MTLKPGVSMVEMVVVMVMVVVMGGRVAAAFWGTTEHHPVPPPPPPPPLPPPSQPSSDTCAGIRTFPAPPSEVYISVLVGVHGGGRCALVEPEGVQVMEAAKWTASKMAQIDFIPGVTLGVNTYDTCGDSLGALRSGVSAVVEGGFMDAPHCQPPYPHVALLVSGPTPPRLSGFLQASSVKYVEVEAADMTPQLETVMTLLQALNWTSVAIVAPSIQALRDFGQLAATFHICVSAEALLHDSSSSVLNAVEGVGGVVVVGPQHRLHALLSAAAHAHNHTRPHWLLVPTGPVQEKVFQGLNDVASGLLAVRRASQTVPEFGEHFLDVAATSPDTTLYPEVSREDYVEEPAVFKMVEAVYRVGSGLRRAVVEQCGGGGGEGWCDNATLTLRRDGKEVIEALSILSQRPKYQVLRLLPTEGGRLAFTQVGHYTNGVLNLTRELLGGPGRPPEYPCLGCRCLNVPFSFLSDLKWRSEPWVTVSATMAIIGFLLVLAITIFILVQCCRGHTSEGSQGFSLLLLLGCIFLYVAILPYSFEASAITCRLRPFVTSLAYAFVFAVMLSRSLMLATSDSEGLVGHVSGIVQTALFFFMVCVQAGLGVQEWLKTPQRPFSPLPPEGGVLYSCSTEPLPFLLSQTYVIFLLMLQFFVAPFVVSSRRNYHEGLLFLIATVFIAAVWVAWITLFTELPPVWSEACVCLGLAATSTVILLTVFVPKTYLIVTASARESANVRPLSRPHSNHDLARASSLVLYDSVRHIPEMIYSPQHAYSPDPTTTLHFPPHKENTYETYSHYQPSPHKVTRF